MARAKRKDRGAAELVAALLAFRDEVGRWPNATELEPSIMRSRGHVEALARFERLDLPGAGSLRHRFGSFENAIHAAETALGARRTARKGTRARNAGTGKG